jgi:hypothetical protein
MSATDHDWTKPAALAIPKEGCFQLERGRYGPVFPRTPACYGFSIIAKVKEGREDAIREHGKTIQAAITETPEFLAPLRLHYLRWLLFDVGDGLTFQYQGIFDTDFDKYTEDAVQLFGQSGISTVFTNLEGFPEDWGAAVGAGSSLCGSGAGWAVAIHRADGRVARRAPSSRRALA